MSEIIVSVPAFIGGLMAGVWLSSWKHSPNWLARDSSQSEPAEQPTEAG